MGDLLMVSTSNGRNEGHTRSAVAARPEPDRGGQTTGEVVWRAIGPGERVLHGQWCSPAVADVNGRIRRCSSAGAMAGCARSTRRPAARSGASTAIPRMPNGCRARGSFPATPSSLPRSIRMAGCSSPWGRIPHGNGPSLLHALSPNGQGDVTDSRRLWTCREVGRVVGTPVVRDGLLYVGDSVGTVYCLDAATGAVIWKHATHAAIWGCLLLAKDRLYVGNEDGVMTVLQDGTPERGTGENRDGRPALFPPGAGGGCALRGHRGPAVADCGEALNYYSVGPLHGARIVREQAPQAPAAHQAARRGRPCVTADAGEGPPPPPARLSAGMNGARLGCGLTPALRSRSGSGDRPIAICRDGSSSDPAKRHGECFGRPAVLAAALRGDDKADREGGFRAVAALGTAARELVPLVVGAEKRTAVLQWAVCATPECARVRRRVLPRLRGTV